MISKLSFSSLGKYLAPIIVGLIVFAIGAPEGLSSLRLPLKQLTGGSAVSPTPSYG